MKIKSIERLRTAIEAERVAAAKVAGWHSYKLETEYQEAVKVTDKALVKVERQLARAAEQSKGGPRPTFSDGGPVHPGAPGPAAGGMLSSIVINGPARGAGAAELGVEMGLRQAMLREGMRS